MSAIRQKFSVREKIRTKQLVTIYFPVWQKTLLIFAADWYTFTSDSLT